MMPPLLDSTSVMLDTIRGTEGVAEVDAGMPDGVVLLHLPVDPERYVVLAPAPWDPETLDAITAAWLAQDDDITSKGVIIINPPEGYDWQGA